MAGSNVTDAAAAPRPDGSHPAGGGLPTSGPGASGRGAERAAVLALAMSAFVLNLNTNVMGALLPFLGGEFDLSQGADSRLLAAAGIGSAVGSFVVADVSRWMGRRTVLLIGLGLFGAASLGHLFVDGYGLLYALRVLSGLASGLSYAAASAAAADIAPYERRGAVMGRFNAGMFLAIPVGMPLTVWLAANGNWPAIFAVQAGVGLLGFVLSWRSVPPLPKTPAARRLPLLRDAGVVAVLLATMLHVGSFFVVVQLSTSWLDEAGLVAKEQQIWLWIGLGALSVVGSAAFGKLSDALGKRRFVLITSAVLVGCFAALAAMPGPVGLLVVGALLALAAAARTGPLQALVSGLVSSEQLGALMGLRGFCMQLGVALFATVSASVSASLGFQGVLLFGAGCQLVSLLSIWFGVHEPAARQDS
ncbi:MAG: MFS transporter [Planctomycetota bacterium]